MKKNEIKELRAENERLINNIEAEQKAYKEVVHLQGVAAGLCDVLETKLEKAKEALEYYADINPWQISYGKEMRLIEEEDMEIADEGGPFAPGCATFIGGKRARQAIKDIEALPLLDKVQEEKTNEQN